MKKIDSALAMALAKKSIVTKLKLTISTLIEFGNNKDESHVKSQ